MASIPNRMGTKADSWNENLSGRERIRRVVETLSRPTPVQKIADRADVSRGTAADELERLERDDWVIERIVDGAKAYDLNPVRLLFDEVTDLIAENSREELEQEFTELKAEIENLATDYDVDSLEAFREAFADETLPADELRQRRNVIETWEALETERDLVKHALHLYDDVVDLSSIESESSSAA